jgi:hypothetical protein
MTVYSRIPHANVVGRRRTFALAVAMCLSISACGVFAPCGSEQRDTIASGQTDAAPATTPDLSASVATIEVREDGGVREVVSWHVLGLALKPHVTRAELRDADGTLLFAIPLNAPEAGSYISVGPLSGESYTHAVPFAHLRARLGSGQTVVELTTSLPDRGVVRLPLTSVRAGGFEGNCDF